VKAEGATHQPVGVEVPASSANLGPGFDALAVALDLPLSVRTASREEPRVRSEG
jgi:homoserine kinase